LHKVPGNLNTRFAAQIDANAVPQSLQFNNRQRNAQPQTLLPIQSEQHGYSPAPVNQNTEKFDTLP